MQSLGDQKELKLECPRRSLFLNIYCYLEFFHNCLLDKELRKGMKRKRLLGNYGASFEMY